MEVLAAYLIRDNYNLRGVTTKKFSSYGGYFRSVVIIIMNYTIKNVIIINIISEKQFSS